MEGEDGGVAAEDVEEDAFTPDGDAGSFTGVDFEALPLPLPLPLLPLLLLLLLLLGLKISRTSSSSRS